MLTFTFVFTFPELPTLVLPRPTLGNGNGNGNGVLPALAAADTSGGGEGEEAEEAGNGNAVAMGWGPWQPTGVGVVPSSTPSFSWEEEDRPMVGSGVAAADNGDASEGGEAMGGVEESTVSTNALVGAKAAVPVAEASAVDGVPPPSWTSVALLSSPSLAFLSFPMGWVGSPSPSWKGEAKSGNGVAGRGHAAGRCGGMVGCESVPCKKGGSLRSRLSRASFAIGAVGGTTLTMTGVATAFMAAEMRWVVKALRGVRKDREALRVLLRPLLLQQLLNGLLVDGGGGGGGRSAVSGSVAWHVAEVEGGENGGQPSLWGCVACRWESSSFSSRTTSWEEEDAMAHGVRRERLSFSLFWCVMAMGALEREA